MMFYHSLPAHFIIFLMIVSFKKQKHSHIFFYKWNLKCVMESCQVLVAKSVVSDFFYLFKFTLKF